MSLSKKVKVAALQSSFTENRSQNIERVQTLIREAAQKGAQIILPSELFESFYFCTSQKEEHFRSAAPVSAHPFLDLFAKLAAELKVVIPVSFFEKDGAHYYNSVAVMDADGKNLGVYRKTHIPDGPGYQEKFYFRPGNTGFKVWKTKYATIGVGICWDQWFPEAARAMVLQGAEILFYPTAIGTEPENPSLDTKDLWQRAMLGHSISNLTPVVAANRVGTENGQTYYGHSFITDHFGNKISEIEKQKEGVIVSEIDLQAMENSRAAFGFFRDRRPELYIDLTCP